MGAGRENPVVPSRQSFGLSVSDRERGAKESHSGFSGDDDRRGKRRFLLLWSERLKNGLRATPTPAAPVLSVMAKSLARVTTFLTDVREELKQVSWPTREELLGSALVVFVGVVLLAAYISVCDFLLSKAAQLLLR